MQNRRFESYYLNEVKYAAALRWQQQEAERVRQSGVARILGLEHASVITLGKRGDLERDLRATRETLSDQKIDVQRIDRGGEATLHSPGQLVVYPLVPLLSWDLGVREFVAGLTLVTQKTLGTFGIRSFDKSETEPGLYTDQGKIAFFGIRVERGVTSHGLAINVRNDLSLFHNIVSCGIRDEHFDSFSQQNINASPLEVFERWSQEFRNHFILTATADTTNLKNSKWSVGAVGSAFP